MKLVFAIIQDEDAQKLMNGLNRGGFMVTKLCSSGGFLKAGNTTLLVGVNEEYVSDVLKIIEEKSKSRKQMVNTNVPNSATTGGLMMPSPIEVTVGGATVFVIDVDQYTKF